MTAARPAAMLAPVVTLAVLLAACGAAGSGGGEIAVSDVRAPVPAGPNAAVYMTLTNDTDTPDRLVDATADVTDAVELHRTEVTDDSMTMQRLDGIDVPAGDQVVLEPGGMHVMLIGAQGLEVGDSVDLTLTFERAGDQQVTAEVVPLVGGSDGHTGHGSEMGADGDP